MWQVPVISRRTGGALVALLLFVKLVLLVWNSITFDASTVDGDYHTDRALFGGLLPTKTSHDGPVYYLPALLCPPPENAARVLRATAGEESEPAPRPEARLPRPTKAEKAHRAELLSWLRHTNVAWLAIFYVTWIYLLFPRLLSGFESWFLASLLLLTLPGYQRMGAMAHPDSAFVAAAALALGGWVLLRERWRSGRVPRLAELAGWAAVIGVMAAARSFAVVPAAVLLVMLVVYARRSAPGAGLKLVARVAGLVAIVVALGASWHAYSRAASQTSFFPELEAERAGFDYGRYYTSFRVKSLLAETAEPSPGAPVENSFFTLLYSDTWGDHWTGFAGPRAKNDKDWPRRALLAAALAVPPLLLAFACSACWSLIQSSRKSWHGADTARRLLAFAVEHEPALVLGAIVLLGGVTFIWWQGTDGLLPGDNSSVKFSYVASLFPPAIALAFGRPLPTRVVTPTAGYFFALYVLAFPIVMYWPAR